MQFKRQGRRVQVLAYTGYDKEKRRAVVQMLGSYDAFSHEPSDGLFERLTADQKQELQSHLKTERQKTEKLSRQCTANAAATVIQTVAESIQGGDFEPSDAWASATWTAITALTKAMRKAGYPKPRNRRDAPMPDQAGLPLGEIAGRKSP